MSSGDDLWAEFVEDCDHIEMVFNGHHKPYIYDKEREERKPGCYHAHSRRTDVRPSGSACHQVLFNAQWEPNGGNGLMLLVTLDGENIQMQTVSSEIDVSPVTVPVSEKDLNYVLKRENYLLPLDNIA